MSQPTDRVSHPSVALSAHPTRLSSRRSLTRYDRSFPPFLSRVDMRRVRKGKSDMWVTDKMTKDGGDKWLARSIFCQSFRFLSCRFLPYPPHSSALSRYCLALYGSRFGLPYGPSCLPSTVSSRYFSSPPPSVRTRSGRDVRRIGWGEVWRDGDRPVEAEFLSYK